MRRDIEINDLHTTFGFGVAGNFAGHLEQAGEAVDFTKVTAAPEMPKGIFPWFVPGADTKLGRFPLADDVLAVPATPPTADAPLRIQIEPEMAVLCDIVRDAAGTVTALTPRWIAAFDDCSLRRPNAAKISDKKNWGAASKGLSSTAFEVSDLSPEGSLATMRLACFLQRGDETTAYGVDSAVATYSLIGQPLLDWLVERLQNQHGSADTPLEDVGALLNECPDTTSVIVGIGATRYEPYGETTFVQPGDEAIVVLYDASVHDPNDVADLISQRRGGELRSALVLRRVARHI